MKTRFLWLAIFSFVILLGFESAWACSCVSNGTPCGFYRGKSGVAFIGTVTSVVASDEKYGKKVGGRGVRKITIKVDEIFKGSVPNEVVTSDDGYNCDNFPFAEGERYLIYSPGVLENTQNILPVDLCGGTKALEEAADDVGFWRQMKKGVMPSVLYGTLQKIVNDEKQPYISLAKTKVILKKLYTLTPNEYIEAKKGEQYEAFTDENGAFKFENVVPATYRLSAELPDDLWMAETREISAGHTPSCDRYPLYAYTNGGLSGRVINADGSPARVSVNVRPIDRPAYYYQSYNWTNEDGNFNIPGLGEGKYRLSVSLSGYQLKDGSYPFMNFPYGEWFYPNTFEYKQAELIPVGYAQRIPNILIKLPPFPVKRTLRGTVAWEDGKPAGGAAVVYKAKRAEGDYQRIADAKEDGSFELEIFDGLEYEISGWSRSNEQPGLIEAFQLDRKALNGSLKLIMKPRK